MPRVWFSATVILFALPALPAESHELDRRCSEAEIQLEKAPLSYWVKENPMATLSGFFSATIDGCVVTAFDDPENDWFIYDIHNSLLRDDKALFHCDRSGVDNVVLEKARALHGYVFNENYSKWLDDGRGGPPRTLKMPPQPYTRDDCRRAFSSKAVELGIPALP